MPASVIPVLSSRARSGVDRCRVASPNETSLEAAGGERPRGNRFVDEALFIEEVAGTALVRVKVKLPDPVKAADASKVLSREAADRLIVMDRKYTRAPSPSVNARTRPDRAGQPCSGTGDATRGAAAHVRVICSQPEYTGRSTAAAINPLMMYMSPYQNQKNVATVTEP